MAGLFAGIQLPVALSAKPTAALVDVQPLDVAPAEEAFFGGYADMLDDLGADMLPEAPQPRAARKVQG